MSEGKIQIDITTEGADKAAADAEKVRASVASIGDASKQSTAETKALSSEMRNTAQAVKTASSNTLRANASKAVNDSAEPSVGGVKKLTDAVGGLGDAAKKSASATGGLFGKLTAGFESLRRASSRLTATVAGVTSAVGVAVGSWKLGQSIAKTLGGWFGLDTEAAAEKAETRAQRDLEKRAAAAERKIAVRNIHRSVADVETVEAADELLKRFRREAQDIAVRKRGLRGEAFADAEAQEKALAEATKALTTKRNILKDAAAAEEERKLNDAVGEYRQELSLRISKMRAEAQSADDLSSAAATLREEIRDAEAKLGTGGLSDTDRKKLETLVSVFSEFLKEVDAQKLTASREEARKKLEEYAREAALEQMSAKDRARELRSRAAEIDRTADPDKWIEADKAARAAEKEADEERRKNLQEKINAAAFPAASNALARVGIMRGSPTVPEIKITAENTRRIAADTAQIRENTRKDDSSPTLAVYGA